MPQSLCLPEVLAPVGDEATLAAALHAGADAVYLGLAEGFNARFRANNFKLESLPERVRQVHLAGAKLYLTLNTLVFEDELAELETLIRQAAEAGVDALIVQDLAVALMAKAICPELPLHASTQMTLSSPQAAAFAAALGIRRMVAPRELSLEQIATLCQRTELEVEVFVQGALCVSWSGQCLASALRHQRSANRGQCAQPCRMKYTLLVDDQAAGQGEAAYWLSPQDLSALDELPALAKAGVKALKIEGRLKGASYVSAALSAVKSALLGSAEDEARLDLQVAFSRNLGPGFLAGHQHKSLIDGLSPTHRGRFLGRVTAVHRKGISLAIADPASAVELRPGMGVVFARHAPEGHEQLGGPIFRCERQGAHWRLGFGKPGPRLELVAVGDGVWLTSDPAFKAKVAKRMQQELGGQLAVELVLTGRLGEPLKARMRQGELWVEASSSQRLELANQGGIDLELVRSKMGAMGQSPFVLEKVDIDDLQPGLRLPVSQLKRMRRELCQKLQDKLEASWRRTPKPQAALEELRSNSLVYLHKDEGKGTHLVVLCRSLAQLEAAIQCGVSEIILDDLAAAELAQAMTRLQDQPIQVGIASHRIQKVHEEALASVLEKHRFDRILLRHWGGVRQATWASSHYALDGDFSLNISNSLAAHYLLGLGMESLTLSLDLKPNALFSLLKAVPPSRATVILYHHLPAFHIEHCLYAQHLGRSGDPRRCGRPCERHRIDLEDQHKALLHVRVDSRCRNTLYESLARNQDSLLPRLLELGIGRLRVDFLDEERDDAIRILRRYEAAMTKYKA